MAYKPPIRETENAQVFTHNKDFIAPDNAFIVSPRSEEDTVTFFQNTTPAKMRDVFNAVSKPKGDAKKKFILFHAIQPGDTVQHTNSKLPNLHVHVYTADFAQDYKHISEPGVKSYTTNPNSDLENVIRAAATAPDGFQHIELDKSNGGEAEKHEILTCAKYESFDDFVNNASDAEFEELRKNILKIITPHTKPSMGGVRIVIDDRYIKTGKFNMQFLSGENLDRSGQNKQRYFEKPKI